MRSLPRCGCRISRYSHAAVTLVAFIRFAFFATDGAEPFDLTRIVALLPFEIGSLSDLL